MKRQYLSASSAFTRSWNTHRPSNFSSSWTAKVLWMLEILTSVQWSLVTAVSVRFSTPMLATYSPSARCISCQLSDAHATFSPACFERRSICTSSPNTNEALIPIPYLPKNPSSASGSLCSWSAAAFAPLLEKPNVTTRSMSAGLMPTPLSWIVSVKVFLAGSCPTSILITPGCPGSTSRIASMEFSISSCRATMAVAPFLAVLMTSHINFGLIGILTPS
mmetsp:Transcript_4718/g.11319  ORF Transcript_4718/g.11319 Transcript_4718/m.11319 type:complete len:220 (+) Transcript_4718:1381-2040(+)